MFGKLFSKPKATANPIRETLFGDMPLDRWPPEISSEEFPWSAFAVARLALAASDVTSAVQQWRQILVTTNLESRHHVQAWNFLRQHGQQQPSPEVAKNVFGVVVDGREAMGAIAKRELLHATVEVAASRKS